MFNEEMAAVCKILISLIEQTGMVESHSRCMIIASEILLSDKITISLSTPKEEPTDV